MGWVEELEELNERESAAVAGHRWGELAELQAERQGLIARLPRPLPAAARVPLERALASSQVAERSLTAALAETKGTLERLRRGRRVVGAYAGPARSGLETRA